MRPLTTQDPFAQRLSHYAQRLESSASRWNSVDSNLLTADRYLDSADRQFDQARFPQRQASFDDGRVDSSWHGRDLDRYFRQGDRELSFSEQQVRSSGHELASLRKEIQESDSGLDQLVVDMQAANDPRLPLVMDATAQVEKADGQFRGVNSSLGRFDSSASWADQAIWRAEAPIREIQFDRPGRSVSHYGYQVGDLLNDIERELNQMDWSLRDADRQGDAGRSQLLAAAEALRQASQSV